MGLIFQQWKGKWRWIRRGGMGVLLIVVLGGVGYAWLMPRDTKMEAIQSTIRGKFPQVKQIEVKELAQWLRQAKESGEIPPQLLDVRSAEEFEVSHLPNAERVSPDADIREVVNRLDPERATVAYCSVGYRSSKLVQRLQEAGHTNVFNLEGSIFAWANQGLPLADSDGDTTGMVHPYGRAWGHLLKARYRATLP